MLYFGLTLFICDFSLKDSQSHSTQYELLDSSDRLEKVFECSSDKEIVVTVGDNVLKSSFEDHISAMHSEFNSNLNQLLEAIKLETQESFTMLPVLNR